MRKKLLNYIQKFRNVEGPTLKISGSTWYTEIIVQIKRVKERRKQKSYLQFKKKSLDRIYNYTFGLNLKRRV